MQLKILGTRGHIEISRPRYRNHSGMLVDKLILCDLGEKKFLHFHPKFILITHLHPDHAYFVAGHTPAEINIPVFAPEKSENCRNIEILTKPIIEKEYKITPVPTIHSLKVRSQGYIIERKNKRIFYTGDIVAIEPKYYHRLHRLDAVITEASFLRKSGFVRQNPGGQKYGHAGVPDLIEFFRKFTHRIIFAHYGSWFIKDPKASRENIKAFETNKLILDTAFDGKEFEI